MPLLGRAPLSRSVCRGVADNAHFLTLGNTGQAEPGAEISVGRASMDLLRAGVGTLTQGSAPPRRDAGPRCPPFCQAAFLGGSALRKKVPEHYSAIKREVVQTHATV